MGSIRNTGRLGAFQSDVFASGLDLSRSQIERDLGVFKAADTATILQGQMVSLDANGELVLADGADVLGVAKWNKASLGTSVIVDEPLVVAADAATNLSRSNVSNVVVRTSAGGAAITAAGDYTLNATNGTLTWDAAPTEVADGDTVFVTFTFDLTQNDYQFQGLNFFNRLNDVDSISEGRLTVVKAPSIIFTTQFDTAQTYTLTGTGSNLYCGGDTAGLEGLFTNVSTEGAYVGRVIQLPTASDPYLGVHFTNVPEEAA